jgi:hypothetical protein
MKKVSNRASLNRYNNFAMKKSLPPEPEIPVLGNTNAVSDEMVTIYERSAEEIIPLMEEVMPPKRLPSLN